MKFVLWVAGVLLAVAGVNLAFDFETGGVWQLDPCDPQEIGTPEDTISSIYRIENGNIAERCFGPSDDDLFRAWGAMAQITTAEERAGLRSFAIFDGAFAAAYTQQLNLEATEFTIAVRRDVARSHGQSLRHVMAHEFAHMLTNHTSNVFSGEKVPTVDCLSDENRYGCAGWGNYLATWTYQFWPEQEVVRLEAEYRSSAEAARRCSEYSGFVTEYGATNPGEDFAETFAAFVLSSRTPASAQSRMNFMSSFPEIVAIRDRINAAGYNASDIYLEGCSR